MTVGADDSSQRWYEFEQVELMVRPFYVRAGSLADARRLVRARKSGSGIGVPDCAPHGPSSIEVRGRGWLADQDLAQSVADEREGGGSA